MDDVYEPLSDLLIENVEETGKELGRGAYGVVYEVKYEGKICAGKKIHDIIVNFEKDAVKKFLDECILHSTLLHPNIVLLKGVYKSPVDHMPMLVMEYLPLSLASCLVDKINLPLKRKYKILLDVAFALNYLHNKKPPIIHRDLSACNVMLTHSFDAKITDLGVSKVMDSSTRSRGLTMVPGNASIMPPESLHFNPRYDTKLDVFSYGCLILHVFTHVWPAPRCHSVTAYLSEWERRSECTQKMSPHHPLFSIAKNCLEDDASLRCDMKNIIQFLNGINVPLEEEEPLYDDILTIANSGKEEQDEYDYDYPELTSVLQNSSSKKSQGNSSLLQSIPIYVTPLPPLPTDRNQKRASVEDWCIVTKGTRPSDSVYDYIDSDTVLPKLQSSPPVKTQWPPDLQHSRQNIGTRTPVSDRFLSPVFFRKKRTMSQKEPHQSTILSRVAMSSNDTEDDLNTLPDFFRPRYPGTPPAVHRKSYPVASPVMDIPSPLPPRLTDKPMTPILSSRKEMIFPSSPPPPVPPLRLASLNEDSTLLNDFVAVGKPLPLPAPPKPLEKKTWYYHSLSKDSAETILSKCHKMDGKFLIRLDPKGVWYLSVYFARKVFHIRIYKNENGCFMLENGQEQLFMNLEKLVRYFQNNLLVLEGRGATFLVV